MKQILEHLDNIVKISNDNNLTNNLSTKYDLEGIFGLIMVFMIPSVDMITYWIKFIGTGLGAFLVLLSIIHKVIEIKNQIKNKENGTGKSIKVY